VSAPVPGSSLERLRELIAAERGELAAALSAGSGQEAFGPLAAAGERTRARAADYALLVESVFEGYLLHYWRPRLLAIGDDNLRLLAGDYLYALGLTRLAGLGDLAAVEELADLITLCAQAHARPASDRPWVDSLGALWMLASLAVCAGPWPQQSQAKQAACAGGRSASEAALGAALERAKRVGIEPQAERALIAFRSMASYEIPAT
jgi:hypothetical protein